MSLSRSSLPDSAKGALRELRKLSSMNAAIVDTDVVSMLFKGDTRAVAYREHITAKLLGISFMTLAELERWAIEPGWGTSRKLDLTRHLAHYTVLPVSRELCFKWAEVSFRAKKKGRPLITNNRSDYSVVDDLLLISA